MSETELVLDNNSLLLHQQKYHYHQQDINKIEHDMAI